MSREKIEDRAYTENNENALPPSRHPLFDCIPRCTTKQVTKDTKLIDRFHV
jgi:hypothetical protein